MTIYSPLLLIQEEAARRCPILDDAIHLYRRFLSGQPGTCIFTGQDDCHAFVTEDEIEATAGSRHDLHHFVWLDQKPGEIGPHGIGFISDDHIDVLRAKHRIALISSERDSQVGERREALKATFLLGAARMSRVLGLPVDAQKRVLPETIDTLPLSLRVRIESLALSSPMPLARLVEKIIPLGATIEDEAERCAAWIAGHEAADDEITRQMLDQLAHKTGKLQ